VVVAAVDQAGEARQAQRTVVVVAVLAVSPLSMCR
jgi:hypothetical protein